MILQRTLVFRDPCTELQWSFHGTLKRPPHLQALGNSCDRKSQVHRPLACRAGFPPVGYQRPFTSAERNFKGSLNRPSKSDSSKKRAIREMQVSCPLRQGAGLPFIGQENISSGVVILHKEQRPADIGGPSVHETFCTMSTAIVSFIVCTVQGMLWAGALADICEKMLKRIYPPRAYFYPPSAIPDKSFIVRVQDAPFHAHIDRMFWCVSASGRAPMRCAPSNSFFFCYAAAALGGPLVQGPGSNCPDRAAAAATLICTRMILFLGQVRQHGPTSERIANLDRRVYKRRSHTRSFLSPWLELASVRRTPGRLDSFTLTNSPQVVNRVLV